MNNNTIIITVKFFANLREYGPKKEVLTIPKNATIKLLFEKYKIPKDEMRGVIIINGRPHYDQDSVLNDGDIVAIFPAIGGG